MTRHDTRSGHRFTYADNKINIDAGIGIAVTDEVPEPVRTANTNLNDALIAQVLADEAVGAAAQTIQAAKHADIQARGQALADGKPAPKRNLLTEQQTKLDDATTDAQAAAVAVTVCRDRLADALNTASADGTLTTAVRTISDRADQHLADTRHHLHEARQARDAAQLARALSRWLDAYPASASDWATTSPTQSADAWRIATDQINYDLNLIEESVPLTVLADRPDLQGTPRRGTKQESKFS